jgi:dihydrofolate synthase/folylpolyglutamate synthase
MLADKDAVGVVAELGRHIAAWYCGGLAGARGQTGEQLAGRIMAAAGPAPVRACESVAAALDSALADSAPEDGVLVFGSFVTVAEAVAHLRGPG